MAKDEFEIKYKLKVLAAGLFVDEEYNFLAGSPDGLVGDDNIIEIKCPHSIKDMTPKEAIKASKIKYLTIDQDGNIQLKRNDNYYYQVQGQLRVANKRACYFIIWTPKGLYN